MRAAVGIRDGEFGDGLLQVADDLFVDLGDRGLFGADHLQIGDLMVDDGHLAEEPYQVEVVEGAQEVGLAEDSVFLAFVADVGVRQPVDDDAGALNAAILDIPRTGDVSVRGGVGVVAEFGFVAVDVVVDDHLVGADASEDEESLEIGSVTVAVGPLGGEQHVVDARQTEVELFGRFVEV